MRIAVAQLNPTIGQFRANLDKLLASTLDAATQGAELVITSELAVPGTPLGELPSDPAFVQEALAALSRLIEELDGPPLLVGALVSPKGDPCRVESRISNGAVLIQNGQVRACHRQRTLDVTRGFNCTDRFTPGDGPTTVLVNDLQVGILVGDLSGNPTLQTTELTETIGMGCQLVVDLAASPYHKDQPSWRTNTLSKLSRSHQVPLIFANQVGGNDSWIFDGRSLATTRAGTVSHAAAPYEESVDILTGPASCLRGEVHPEYPSWEADVIDALCLGLSDYVRKCGFARVVVGLSGGIDSAVTCALAVRSLGAEHVVGVAMPSQYSSTGSVADARELAHRLGIELHTIPISSIFSRFNDSLKPVFGDRAPDVTEENLQARIRGTLLMAYANKTGSLLLCTGNKSEVAVGYATLYGDMCGGLAVISDLYKGQVYAIARQLNSEAGAPIPESSLTKPPSAELAPGQTDQDSLPPYEILDSILEAAWDHQAGLTELLDRGFHAELAGRVLQMTLRAEHKRRQGAPGLRVSRRPWGGSHWRPIALGFRYPQADS